MEEGAVHESGMLAHSRPGLGDFLLQIDNTDTGVALVSHEEHVLREESVLGDGAIGDDCGYFCVYLCVTGHLDLFDLALGVE